MTTLWIVVFLTLFISAHCSLFEAIFYSTRWGTLEAEIASGAKTNLAKKMVNMKRDVSSPIAAILILNTIANTAGATIAGMFATRQLGPEWVPYFSAALTFAILFLSEIMPKTLGVMYWKKLWPFTVWPLTVMRLGLYPAIYIINKFSGLFLKSSTAPLVTEEEILASVRLGARSGEISAQESELVHNIISLENIKVRDIMTPRTVVFLMNGDQTVQEAYEEANSRGFTRVPLYEDEKENVTGYILLHELDLEKNRNHNDKKLREIAKSISFVPQSANCLATLRRYLKERNHISMVVDEYGGIVGLLTLEDLLETLLGAEIVDETDKAVDLREEARRIRRTQRGGEPKPPDERAIEREGDWSPGAMGLSGSVFPYPAWYGRNHFMSFVWRLLFIPFTAFRGILLAGL